MNSFQSQDLQLRMLHMHVVNPHLSIFVIDEGESIAFPISLLAKVMATARDRSAVVMRRFQDGGDVTCNFDSDDDDEDDDNILHFDLRGCSVSIIQ